MTTIKRSKRAVNYGKRLEAAIVAKGLKRVKVAEKMGITRQWLNVLLVTGNFTPEQMVIVRTFLKK